MPVLTLSQQTDLGLIVGIALACWRSRSLQLFRRRADIEGNDEENLAFHLFTISHEILMCSSGDWPIILCQAGCRRANRP